MIIVNIFVRTPRLQFVHEAEVEHVLAHMRFHDGQLVGDNKTNGVCKLDKASYAIARTC